MAADSVTIRAATEEDLPGILAIYNDAVLKTTATYDYEPRTLEHRRAWLIDHQKLNLPVFVAVKEDAIIGWSALNRYHDRMGYRFTTENSIYIAEQFRGQGVGKLLLQPLIQSARTLGMHVILAVIDADNASSIRLHARFGFIEVGRFREIGFKFGRWLDVVYMELLL